MAGPAGPQGLTGPTGAQCLTGLTGPAGPPGANGVSGPSITVNGLSVPANGVAVATVECPTGYTLVGGGYTSDGPNTYGGIGEKGHPNSTNTGWEVTSPLDNTAGAAIHAWAICLPVG